MKKFAAKAVVLAIGAACGSTYAGTITSPATDAAATKYAVEGLTSASVVTTVPLVYTMGVARTTAQDFTIIVTPSSGSTFAAGACLTSVPIVAVAGAGTATVKRAGPTECAYEVDVTTATTTATTLTFAGFALATHPLATVGSSVSLTVNVWDLGETARIDTTAPLTRKVATSNQAVNVYAATSDTATTADVNAVGGPLTGFVVGGAAPADTAIIAKANLTFDNNSIGAVKADGVTAYDFTATTGTASITLTGPTFGLKANNFCIDLDGDATLCEVGEVFTATSSAASLASIPSTTFPSVGTTATKTVSFQADGTTQLGTSRTFALTGTITPGTGAGVSAGAAEALADTNGKNATAWVWTANASQLMTPYMSTNALYVTRFSLLNTGSAAVGYSVQCYTEGSSTATNGANGTLKAAGTTVLNALDVCSFSDTAAPRGAVIFTINAPISSVKGVYNIVDKVSGANGFVPLTRPYNGASTTE